MPEVSVEHKTRPESSTAVTPRYESRWWPHWPSEVMTASPFAVARRMFDEMDRTFAGWMRWPDFRAESAEGWYPSVDVIGEDGKLIVRADLPGLNKEDVKVEVSDGDLLIQGERKREHEERGRGIYRSERSYGRFTRRIPLPEGAKTGEAKAQFNNGVLEVSIPVPQSAAKSREVPIETGQKK